MKKKPSKTKSKSSRKSVSCGNRFGKSANLSPPPTPADKPFDTCCAEGATPYLKTPTPEPTIYDRRKSLLHRLDSQLAEVEYLQDRLLREQVTLTHLRNELTNVTRELQAELTLTAASA